MKATQALPADKQIEAVSKKLMELNPGFDGKAMGFGRREKPTVKDDVVTELKYLTDNVTDISPLRALMGLKGLACVGSGGRNGKLSDLSPLQGMPLTNFSCSFTQVSDLSPLQGSSLQYLYCQFTQISDLSPLKGMQLIGLDCGFTQVSDLAPLAGMPLDNFQCNGTKIVDLAPLHQCKSLAFLQMRTPSVTPAEVAAPQKALPNCKIEWDDPAKPRTLAPAASGGK